MQAVLWCTESFAAKSALDEHSQMITDIRFSPSMSRLATSSADKTVRVWDVDNVSAVFSWFNLILFPLVLISLISQWIESSPDQKTRLCCTELHLKLTM